MAMTISLGETPFSLARATSLSFIWREAMAMLVVPSMMALMPLPEPPPDTDRVTSLCMPM